MHDYVLEGQTLVVSKARSDELLQYTAFAFQYFTCKKTKRKQEVKNNQNFFF